MELREVIRRRGMIRAFQDRSISAGALDRILDAAHRAPSAGFTQPVEIVVVRDAARRQALVDAALQQEWAGAAPVVLVVCADTRRSARRYGERGRARYSIIDGAFASMLILLTAVDEGLGACFVGAFDDDAVRRALEIPGEVLPLALIPVGYAAERPPRYRRRPLREIVHQERW